MLAFESVARTEAISVSTGATMAALPEDVRRHAATSVRPLPFQDARPGGSCCHVDHNCSTASAIRSASFAAAEGGGADLLYKSNVARSRTYRPSQTAAANEADSCSAVFASPIAANR